jgi:hypothetical protein
MHNTLKKGFQRNGVLLWSTVAACLLWTANAVMNISASGHRSFFVNLMYILCLIILCFAEFKQEKNIVQGMIGALLMAFLFGNHNVVMAIIDKVADGNVPSRADWQIIVGFILALALFVNHFLIASPTFRSMRRINMNQIIVVLIILLRTMQVLLNIFGPEHTNLSVRSSIGVLAIIPTLNVILCIESRGEYYKVQTL